MKKILLLVFIFIFQQQCFAENKLSQLNFAYGMPIIISQISPLYTLTLPKNFNEQTAFPDLRDIRIFNQEGANLTYTLKNDKLIFVGAGTPPYILAFGNNKIDAPSSEVAANLLNTPPAEVKLGEVYKIAGASALHTASTAPSSSHWLFKCALIIIIATMIKSFLKNKPLLTRK